MSTLDDAATDLLPLRPVVFSVLAVLRSGPTHGHGVMESVNHHIGRPVLLGPGTLYRVLKEMREEGLLEYAPPPDGDDVDGRRQYHRLTDLGRRTVEAEARRLASLMRGTDLLDATPEQSR